MIETLYYLLDVAVLKGSLEDAKMYLSLLRDEYEKDETNFEILEKDDRLEHLKKLGKIVDNNLVVKTVDWEQKENLFEVQKDEYQVKKEKDLVKLIFKNQEELKQQLNVTENFKINSIELPTLFGRIDLVAQDNKTIYVIEVKKGLAKHDIIGQIQKYMFHFQIRKICKLWSKVVGVIIANSFEKFTINELASQNIICLKYVFNNKKLRLSKLCM